MSRSAGFTATLNGKEVFWVGWKNYLNVDTVIYCLARDNKLATVVPLNNPEDTKLIFNGIGAFYWLYHELVKTLDWNFWISNDIMDHSPEDAAATWGYILNEIDRFLKHPYEGELIIEYYECN